MTPETVPLSFFLEPATELAPRMLGMILCRRNGDRVDRFRITETECYYGEEDTACHASRGRTARTEILYRPGGEAYIHRCHMYWLITLTTGPEGHPEGVLIRGIEGHDGPGRTGRALGLDRSLYGTKLTPDGPIWLESNGCTPGYGEYERIGIGYASEEDRSRKWRFRISDD